MYITLYFYAPFTQEGPVEDKGFPHLKVLRIYILRVNMNGKMKGNAVDASLLFLISVYEFSLLL